ncbi:MAG: hypothetical protein AMJ69_00325 [Gammaproteobacteria bacterium SG8_47]|nr:MAG: hypothetical protein AMJ69_00325 [Gammaproteobacteria bacterium SG8_47]
MTIRHWPAEERPRERLLALGPQSLSDAELLAVFLRTGIRGKTAVDLARELLTQFGGLRGLLQAPRAELCRHPGLGSAKYAQLQAAAEFGRRHAAGNLVRGESLSSPDQAQRFLSARLGAYPYEVFAGLFLDARHRVLAWEELFRGSIDGASVHPREVVRRALHYNAAALILAHNHPSGVAEPSQADRAVTQRLQQALALVDVRVLDHIVVGHGQTVSFAARGLL